MKPWRRGLVAIPAVVGIAAVLCLGLACQVNVSASEAAGTAPPPTVPQSSPAVDESTGILVGPGPVLTADEAMWQKNFPPAKPALSLTATIPHFSATDTKVVDILRTLSRDYGLRYGLEEVPWKAEEQPSASVSLQVEGATVREVLDYLVRLDRRYAWESDGDYANFFLRQASEAPDYPLNVPLEAVTISGKAYVEATGTVMVLLYEKTGFAFGQGARHPRGFGPQVTLSRQDATGRRLFNEIARQADMCWEIRAFEPDKAGLLMARRMPAEAASEASNTEALVAGLQSPNWADRIWAATTMGDIGGPSAAPALLGALREESELSAEALAQRGWEDPEAGLLVADVHATLLHAYYLALTRLEPAAATEIRTALADAAPATADYLHIVLAYWGNADVASQVIELVQSAPDGYTRAYAARALGHLGMSEAIPVLEKALEDPFVVTRGDVRVPLVRECARAALAQLAAPRIVTPTGPSVFTWRPGRFDEWTDVGGGSNMPYHRGGAPEPRPPGLRVTYEILPPSERHR